MSSRVDDVVVTVSRARARGRTAHPTRSGLTRIAATAVVTWTLVLVVALSTVLVLHQRNGIVAAQAELALSSNTEVVQLMTNAESGLRGYLLTKDPTFLQPSEQARSPLADTLDRLDRLASTEPSLAAPIRAQRVAADTWWAGYAEPVLRGDAPVTSDAGQLAAKTAFDDFRTANADLAHDLRDHRDTVDRHQRLAFWLSLAGVLLLAGLGGLLLVRPSLRAVRQIGPPLEDLERTVDALQAGDLSARADTNHATGEILSVARTLNDFAARNELTRDRLAEEVRLSQVVVDLGMALTTTLDLDQVVRESAERVSTQLNSMVWIRAFDVQVVRCDRGRAAYPVELDLTPPAALVESARRVNEHCWQRQTSALITREQPGVPALMSAEDGMATLDYLAATGATAVLFVPVGAGQEALGYLTLGRTADQAVWSDLERAAAQQIGREVGRAVLLARLFERDQDLIDKLDSLELRQHDFVTMASHALRTPLASITGHLEIMRSGDLGHYDPDLEGSMVAIERNSRRLNRMADDFLLLARLEDGTSEHRPETVDLQLACRAAIESEAERASAGDLSVVLTVHGRVAALGVAAELQRAIDSLLSNAIKFSPIGSTVKLSVYDDPVAGTATVEVVDHGFGIAPADQQRLFGRFFRAADAIEREVPGTGIGLRIANLVAEKHAGAIAVSSDPELGTRFTLTLQRAEPPARPVVVADDDSETSYADAPELRAGAVA